VIREPVELLLLAAGAVLRQAPGMSQQAAELTLLCIAAAGGLVWLLTLKAWRRLSAPQPGEQYETDLQGGSHLVQSEVAVVSGDPADVADGLVRALGSPSWGTLPLLVKREGHSLIVAVPATGPSLLSVPCFSRCAAELRGVAPGRTEVTFKADCGTVRLRARMIGGVLLIAGALVLVALPAGLYLLAARAASPALRFQVVQTIHVGHLLWPPWLVFAMYRRTRRATAIYLQSAANNAAALAEAFAVGRARAANASD
jgi:hypothetical protein